MRRVTRSKKTQPARPAQGETAKVQAVQQNQAPQSDVTPPPSWFSWAIAEPFEKLKIPVSDHKDDGVVDIECLRWGASKTKRGLVMIHGGGANASWYRFIAPFFASKFECIAISNSGNGDSGKRTEYSLTKWSSEIHVCCEKLGLFEEGRPKPYILAHSLGTYVTVNLLRGIDFPNACEKYGGALLADGAIRPYDLSKSVHERVMEIRANDPNTKPRAGWPIYPPSLAPSARFKLRPFQECDNAYILKFIAEASREIVDEDGSWCWKGDCNREAKLNWSNVPIFCDKDVLAVAKEIPVAFMYGEDSILCDSSVAEFVRKSLGEYVSDVGIPCAAHHIWLDQPLAFVSAIRGILAGWPSSDRGEASAIDEEDLLRREALLESRL